MARIKYKDTTFMDYYRPTIENGNFEEIFCSEGEVEKINKVTTNSLYIEEPKSSEIYLVGHHMMSDWACTFSICDSTINNIVINDSVSVLLIENTHIQNYIIVNSDIERLIIAPNNVSKVIDLDLIGQIVLTY